MKLLSKARSKVVLAALLLGAIPAIWLLTRSAGNDVEWLAKPPAVRRSRLAFLGQWKQPVKEQLLRAKYWLFGRPQTVAIRADFLELDSPAAISNLISSPAMFSNAAGARCWIIKDATPWRSSLTNPTCRVFAVSTVTILDGMQASVSVSDSVPTSDGIQNLGFDLNLIPEVRGDFLNLTSFLLATERAAAPVNTLGGARTTNVANRRTNAEFGVRVHLAKGASIFLLAGGTNDHSKVIGVLLSPAVWPKK